MEKIRRISKVIKSTPTIEGAGVHLQRVIGFDNQNEFDPFLLLDDFSSKKKSDFIKGFPWHPHRGIETITYVLSGSVEHQDSIGNKGVIGAGDLQWMTAGSGIYHQEMPEGDKNGSITGFQLWANLPAKDKMIEPQYRDIKAEDIPSYENEDGVIVKVIAGNYKNITGPVSDVVTSPEYYDVFVPGKSFFKLDINSFSTLFVYIIEGSALFCEENNPDNYERKSSDYLDTEYNSVIGEKTLVSFDSGDYITVSADDNGVRFILVAGNPLKEPVAWYGPIVMNTREELNTAFRELDEGTFIKQF